MKGKKKIKVFIRNVLSNAFNELSFTLKTILHSTYLVTKLNKDRERSPVFYKSFLLGALTC